MYYKCCKAVQIQAPGTIYLIMVKIEFDSVGVLVDF